jgi:proline dehydrogenase
VGAGLGGSSHVATHDGKKRQQEIIRMTLSNAAHKAEKKSVARRMLEGETDCLSHSITFHFQPLLQFSIV